MSILPLEIHLQIFMQVQDLVHIKKEDVYISFEYKNSLELP